MKQNRKIVHRLSGILDMSAQQLPGVPIVELAGTKRVLIENHRGVIEYDSSRIRISVKFGKIDVTGSGLEICYMSRQQLIITGQIDSVQIERGCEL